MHGFYRVAAAVPELEVGAVGQNVARIVGRAREAAARDTTLLVLPELCLTGATCADLFHQQQLQQAVDTGIRELLSQTAGLQLLLLVGAPVLHRNRLYNCALAMQSGELLGVIPKTFLPNYKEFYEKRWFHSGAGLSDDLTEVAGKTVPFGVDLLFAGSPDFTVGVELCEDLWAVMPPSCSQALAGATVLTNLSASNELVGKAEYRRQLVRGQSGRCVAAYVYASAGVGESTTDLVYSGHAMVAENGQLLAENARFEPDGCLIFADIDVQRLAATRLSETSYGDHPTPSFRRIPIGTVDAPVTLERVVDARPFVPEDTADRHQRCREIFNIQASGLAKRLLHTHAKRAVLGLSGGLDSTLALLVAREAWQRLGRKPEHILAVTMPGFGTTDRTYGNATRLAEHVGAELREIDIVPACKQHFQDIGHPPAKHDTTYENVQARERTQLLMDIANQTGGLVVGTGDLSEIALGWSTYNGDHISMYAVNCGVPKTLVRYVIAWVAERASPQLAEVLEDILDTPVTPELLPKAENGELMQKTEEVIGPYELHDFFLYHMVKYGASPEKLRYLAGLAFRERYGEEEIETWLRVFITRFFRHQFKRSCIPDGPKVGTISLSPRGDWRMPSDAVASEWLDSL